MKRVLAAVSLLLAACGGAEGEAADASSTPAAEATVAQAQATATTTAAASTSPVDTAACAHVVDGAVQWQEETATVSATVRSADTGWDKYADAWEIRGPDGEVLGVRELAHPHETEQPFTRSLSGVVIPEGVDEVVLAAHDSVAGWCGDVFTLAVPDRP